MEIKSDNYDGNNEWRIAKLRKEISKQETIIHELEVCSEKYGVELDCKNDSKKPFIMRLFNIHDSCSFTISHDTAVQILRRVYIDMKHELELTKECLMKAYKQEIEKFEKEHPNEPRRYWSDEC